MFFKRLLCLLLLIKSDHAPLSNIELSKLIYIGLIASQIRYSMVLWGSTARTNSNKMVIKKKIKQMHGQSFSMDYMPKFKLYLLCLFFKPQFFLKKKQGLTQPHTHYYNTRNKLSHPPITQRLKLTETKPELMGLNYFINYRVT